jgi:hypothetical protein
MTIVADAPAGFPLDIPLERELETMGIRYRRVIELPLDKVRITPEAQVRSTDHQGPPARVARYAVQMKAGATFPPIVVAEDPTDVATFDLVDGNTRSKAARDKEVQRDTFAAYVLQGVTYEQCREVGVYMNQRNGKDLDKTEALNWINDALEAKMPLSRIARISGFSFQTVKKLDGVREFNNRTKKLELPPAVKTLPSQTQALLADKVQHDNVFRLITSLATDSAMSKSELQPLVDKISKTGTDDEALRLIAREREAREAQIKEYAAAAERRPLPNGQVGTVRPPYYVQMRKHLQFLLARGPLDLFDPTLTSREDSEQLLRETRQRLDEALELYAERKRAQSA